jgi:cardiolipin synthase A/B
VNTAPEHLKDRGEDLRQMRGIAERAFSRTAGAPLIGGNTVKLLLNGAANYEAWLKAIERGQHAVYFENYIIAADKTGTKFRDALAQKAREGVSVRVMLDWLGSYRTPRDFWEPVLSAGGKVRYHNAPRFDSPLGWLSRDHRKSLIVDGTGGFVSGICVSDTWLGSQERNIEPWRDTGIALSGPACAELVAAFAQVWDENGRPIPKAELESFATPGSVGDVAVRVIATAPNLAGIYRTDLLIAAIASRRLWLTDAYFAGVPAYVQALRAAARDGVDVRLLVPGGSDLPWLRPLTTAGYRPLLEAGVRVFEWNGSMLHAKTAVADGKWARVGSTNLNIASWLTNWELDVAIEDEPFAREMEGIYEQDLTRATEVVLRKRRPFRLPCVNEARSRPGGGSLARATAGALRLSRTVGAAVMNRRILGPAEAWPLAWIALLPLVFAVLAIWFPRLIAWPLAFLAALLSVMLVLRAWRLRRAGRKRNPGTYI